MAKKSKQLENEIKQQKVENRAYAEEAKDWLRQVALLEDSVSALEHEEQQADSLLKVIESQYDKFHET